MNLWILHADSYAIIFRQADILLSIFDLSMSGVHCYCICLFCQQILIVLSHNAN